MARSNEPIRKLYDDQGKVRGYRIVVDAGHGPDGKRRQLTKTVKTRKDAVDWLATTRADLARGTFLAKDTETLDSLLDRWLNGRRDIRAVTVQGYRDNLVPARKRLGYKAVQQLTPADIDGLATWMLNEGGKHQQGLSPRSVTATLGALSQALDLAVREGIVSRNVSTFVKRPRQRTPDTARWSPDQVQQFREHVDGDRYEAPWLLSLAGLRRSEVLGLRWADVNLDTGEIRIEQGRVAVTPTTYAIDAPKSAQSRRVVPVGLMPGVAEALRSFKARQSSERLALGGAYADSGLVVVDEVGVPPRPEWYSDRFRKLCVSAGVPSIKLHALRHSVADFLLGLGMPAIDVAAWLGHTTEVLHERYGRATPGGVERVGNALGSMYASR